MKEKHGKYEFVKEIVQRSGDFDDWIYHIKNTESNITFDYRINISASTLSSTGLPMELQLVADTEGDNLVKESLEKGEEQKLQIRITTGGIETKRLSKDQGWIDWKEFSSLATLATRKDFEEYFNTYKQIFKRILKSKYGIEARAYVSKIHGSLLLLEFRPGEDRLEYHLVEDKGIGSVLMHIPQKGFGGNLENMKFRGVNKVIEEDKIIYIKGENTRDVWSKRLAEKEAREEIEMITKPSK